MHARRLWHGPQAAGAATASREKPATLATNENPAAIAIAAQLPCTCETVRQKATSAAPVDCPIRRAVATMPLALPLRFAGAALMMAFTLGAWKKPKPIPHTAMRQPIATLDGASGMRSSVTRPADRIIRPTPPRRPGG